MVFKPVIYAVLAYMAFLPACCLGSLGKMHDTTWASSVIMALCALCASSWLLTAAHMGADTHMGADGDTHMAEPLQVLAVDTLQSPKQSMRSASY